MKKLKKILDFYIHTSLHIGFAVLALVKITTINLKICTDWQIELFIFFATVLCYNVLKNFKSILAKTYFIKPKAWLNLVNTIALIFLLFLYIKLKTPIQFALIKIAILVLIYPFLRKVGILKIYIVAFCFAYVTVYIPALNNNLNQGYYLMLIYQRFIFVICLIIPFEILDCKTDKLSFKTLPQLIGITLTKITGIFLCVFLILLTESTINTIIAVILIVFIIFSDPKRHKQYTLFWVESIPVFWWLLYIIQNAF